MGCAGLLSIGTCGLFVVLAVWWHEPAVLFLAGLAWNVAICVRSGGFVVFGWFRMFIVGVVCGPLWVLLCGPVLFRLSVDCGDLDQIWWFGCFRLFSCVYCMCGTMGLWLCSF